MGSAFAANLALAVRALEAVSDSQWEPTALLDMLKRLAESHGLKLGDVMQPIRVALTGSTVSEPVNELLAVVGRERSLRRLKEVARRHGGETAA
jgi:glutamyl-tRNA synthetase